MIIPAPSSVLMPARTNLPSERSVFRYSKCMTIRVFSSSVAAASGRAGFSRIRNWPFGSAGTAGAFFPAATGEGAHSPSRRLAPMEISLKVLVLILEVLSRLSDSMDGERRGLARPGARLESHGHEG